MIDFTLSQAWRTAYPDAFVGVLAMGGVHNPAAHPELEQEKAALESALRRRYADYDRQTLRAQPPLNAYHAYYKRFKKSYHVQLQLESVVWREKAIPRVAALVEAMFMAELQNQLLTAGHDLDTVQLSVGVDVAVGDESFMAMNGRSRTLKAGDMFIADQTGILSSVIYGPARRTRIEPQTTRALFTVYAPPGVTETAVRQHLQTIREYITIIAPQADTESLAVYGAE